MFSANSSNKPLLKNFAWSFKNSVNISLNGKFHWLLYCQENNVVYPELIVCNHSIKA
jgi:hypothetical protein